MTMKPVLTAAAVLAVMTLSGCDKAGDKAGAGDKTMDEAKQEAAQLDRPKPGFYKQSITITKFELPGTPPEVAQQIQAAMQKAQVHEFCMTKEMADQGFRDMFDKIGNGSECTYDRFEVRGGKVDAVLKCQNPAEGIGLITFNGKVSEESSEVNVAVDQQGGRAPMNDTKIAMHMVSQRIGDCPGGQ